MLATSTTSPGLKASVPRACQRSPWAKTAFALGPVEDFGGQAAHGLRAEPYGAFLGTSKRAEDNQDQADEDRRRDADHRPR